MSETDAIQLEVVETVIRSYQTVGQDIIVPSLVDPLYSHADKAKPVEVSRRPCTADELGRLITNSELCLAILSEESPQAAAKRASRTSVITDALTYGVITVVPAGIGVDFMVDKNLHMRPAGGALMLVISGLCGWLGIKRARHDSDTAAKDAFEKAEKTNERRANLQKLSCIARAQLETTEGSE